MPWRKLLITTAAVAGVLGMVTGNTDAREMGYGSRASVHANAGVNHNARVTVRTRADFNARATAGQNSATAAIIRSISCGRDSR